MLSQMLFKPGDYKFNVLSENVHYLFLYKSPRNSSKIIHLAKQVSPYDNKFIVQSYRQAISKEFHIYCLIVIRVHQKGFDLDLKCSQVKEL